MVGSKGDAPISPLAGEMSDRTDGGASLKGFGMNQKAMECKIKLDSA